MTESRFDDASGYYSCRTQGVEYARFAPCTFWSDYAAHMQATDPDFSYVFVSTRVGI